MQLAQSIPACTRATCINVVGSYLWLKLQQLSYYTLLISSQFNSVFFVLFCNCIPALLYFRIPPRGSSLQVTLVSVSHLPSASTGHVGCCVIYLFATKQWDVWVACRLHCKSSVAAFSWHLVPGTSWILHVMNCVLNLLCNLFFAGTGCPVL